MTKLFLSFFTTLLLMALFVTGCSPSKSQPDENELQSIRSALLEDDLYKTLTDSNIEFSISDESNLKGKNFYYYMVEISGNDTFDKLSLKNTTRLHMVFPY